MALFRNFYQCSECGHQWSDLWSAMCDDDCPHCGARHMSPYHSEDAPASVCGGGVHVKER
jgi:predicted  nucleic acid-binding Zn-ribbon protein